METYSRRDKALGRHLLQRGGASDLELVQFIKLGWCIEEAASTLVTEAVRGEGGRLTVRGERFMKEYDAHRMELST
jgi:aspartate oxidase